MPILRLKNVPAFTQKEGAFRIFDIAFNRDFGFQMGETMYYES